MSYSLFTYVDFACIRPFQNLLGFGKIAMLLFSGVVILPSAQASHIVGGDITYRCLGNQQYEITLTLRRDCLNGNPGAQFDNPAALGIFDNQGRLQTHLGNVGRLLMQFRQDDTLNEVLAKSCGIIGGDVCVHTTAYIDTIELPRIQGGYILAYQRCCRNYTIRNIVDPLASGATYTLEITEDALRLCNNSPSLGNYPPIYICGGQPIGFNLNAKDTEGDSLVYRLCTPYLGADQLNPRPATPSNPPYDEVVFSGAYNLFDMIGGVPALNINSNNGFMSGFAEPVIAQYLIAYCVEEYRNGVLLSILRRDFQINVRLCNSTPVADFNLVINQCRKPFELKLDNLSTDAFSTLEKYFWEFRMPGQNQTSALKDPVILIQADGLLEIQLIVESKELCRDTLVKTFLLKEAEVNLKFKSDTICLMDSIELTQSFDPNFKYEWSPAIGLSCIDCPNPRASPDKSTRYFLKSYDGTCERFDTIDVFVKPCTDDPCMIFLEKECLPSGMIRFTAVDGNSRMIQPKVRDRELFWNIHKNANHPEYTVQNQNPVLVFENDVVSLTYKFYKWPAGKPKSIEYAEICQQKWRDTAAIDCTGPCSDLEFILASCEDDYHKLAQLNYPNSICKTICGGACQFIIGLFETKGQLINPADYEVLWSNGSKGAFVELMTPYFNNLSVTVRKGDCVWSGRYYKSCNLYNSLGANETQLKSIYFRKGSGTRIQTNNCKGSMSYSVWTMDGKKLCNDLKQIEFLMDGIYHLVEESNADRTAYLLIVH